MKRNLFCVFLFFIVTIGNSVNSINTIMPLGASRTAGKSPKHESYRYELWKILIENNFSFDFIGTRKDLASYPQFENKSFDNDHEGKGGINTVGILAGLKDWLKQSGSPDIVLFESPGGNDFLQGKGYEETILNINEIIDILQENNPKVTIIIEQTAPVRSSLMMPNVEKALNKLHHDVVIIASKQSTDLSKVITVDMFTGFNDSLLADPVHYNNAGAAFIARRYYDVLKNILK